MQKWTAPAPGDMVTVTKGSVYRETRVLYQDDRGINATRDELRSWQWPSTDLACTALMVSDPEWMLALDNGDGRLRSVLLCKLLTPWGPAYAHPGSLKR